MIVSFTRAAGNSKTGPIPNTMTERASCPDACPFKADESCYPNYTPLGFMWIALEHKGYFPGVTDRRRIITRTWSEMCKEVSKLPRHQIWRHNTAGDLPGVGNVIDTELLDKLVKANKKAKARGFTYTHKPVGRKGLRARNAEIIRKANEDGFVINLSADNLKEADRLADLNIGPVVVVVPSDAPRFLETPKGRKVIACPHEYNEIQCDRCQICAKQRKAIVAFHVHGKKKKLVDKRLKDTGQFKVHLNVM